MKYLLKMSWRFLREQKLRTFLTAVCLTLAVFVVGICGVFGSSALYSVRNLYRVVYGSYHFQVSASAPDGKQITPEGFDVLRHHDVIEQYGEIYSYSPRNFAYDQTLPMNYNMLYNAEPGTRLNCWRITLDDYSCTTVNSYSSGFLNYDANLMQLLGQDRSIFPSSPIGRMPEQAGEIVLPLDMREGRYDSWLKMIGAESQVKGKGYQIGDTIHITIQNGTTAYSGSMTEDQEMLQTGASVEATYRVVGFGEYGMSAVIHTSDTQLSALQSATPAVAYCRIRDGVDYTSTLDSLMKEVGLGGILGAEDRLTQNEGLLTMELRGDDAMTKFAGIFGLVFLLGIFLFFFIRLVIDNAFEMSTQERVRQFAILRTVGASRWQIAVMVMLEGILYAIVAIPLGMGGACLLGYGDLQHFCASVKNLGSETAVEYLSCVQFHLYAPVMLLTVLIALWSILISAYTSAMWAAKVDPMQAAQFGKPKKEKKIRHKVCRTRHRFGFALYFARLNQKRNKKRYRITMFSVAMGMVMFMTCYGLNRTIQYILRVQMAGIYDVRASVSAERYTAAEGLAQIRKSGMFTDCYVSDMVTLNVDLSGLAESRLGENHAEYPDVYDATELGVFFLPVDQTEYEAKYQKAVGLSYADFCSSGGLYLGSTALVYVERDSGLSAGYHREVELLKPSAEPIQATLLVNKIPKDPEKPDGEFEPIWEAVTISGVFNSAGCSELIGETTYNASPTLYGIVDVDRFEEYCFLRDYQGEWKRDVTHYTMNYAPGKQQEAKEWLAQQQQAGFLTEYDGECSAEVETTQFVLDLFTRLCYHFVLILLGISVFTIMNTMNTAILNRRHELGMLRAVGMSAKQIRLTLLSEACRYVVKAAVGSSLVAGGICLYLVYSSFYTSRWIWFLLPGALIALGVGLVFAVLSTLVPLRSLEKSDAAQVIREIN